MISPSKVGEAKELIQAELGYDLVVSWKRLKSAKSEGLFWPTNFKLDFLRMAMGGQKSCLFATPGFGKSNEIGSQMATRTQKVNLKGEHDFSSEDGNPNLAKKGALGGFLTQKESHCFLKKGEIFGILWVSKKKEILVLRTSGDFGLSY